MIDKLVSIRHAANLLGITIQTIRNWDKQGFLKPDILVKGADYKDKLVVGADIVSRVELIDFEEGFSTSKIIEKIKDKK
ncbi:hypothetical protein AJN58_00805 [Campylobacter sp. BCW_4321]|uniref:MerR family transcriptional regulator n=1 Tax=Campylobacter sp. BCW_4321 TaxID=1903586 RepID=UPI0008746F21|nr:MerR family DNA-binding transcriptional regulator [Campylobacter sp. BCW_4321]OEW69550.1 hypothetical protein AJN58_00805 [Campylobacter sp. BCW_4321]